MMLYLNDILLGALSDYGYETPWATARLTPADAELHRRLCAASQFLSVDIEEDWGEQTSEESDREYERRLQGYGITEADVEAFQSGQWEVRNPGSSHLQGPIVVSECDERGWVTWRWA